MAATTHNMTDGRDLTSSSQGSSPQAAALEILQPLQPVLQGFAHRNKNQHRGARWWGDFGMLRRHTGKLVFELGQEITAADCRKTKTASRKHKKKSAADHGTTASASPAESRACWMRDVLVPKTYFAFSQLTADNQFATLGIILVSALSQIRAACVLLVGEPEQGEEEEEEEKTIQPSSSFPATTNSPQQQQVPATTTKIRQQQHEDQGQQQQLKQQGGAVVSREEAARLHLERKMQRKKEGEQDQKKSIPKDEGEDEKDSNDGDTANSLQVKQEKPNFAIAPSSSRKRLASTQEEEIKKKSKPRRPEAAANDNDDGDGRGQQQQPPAAKKVKKMKKQRDEEENEEEEEGKGPKKKKKKAKKGGDEFDNLFNSLM